MREYWKFLQLDANGQIVSNHDMSPWTIGEWRETAGEIAACENGFHCSPNPLDALAYVRGTVVARVEVGGACHDEGDKSAHQRMRLVRAWLWTADDSVQFAIFTAEQVLSIYEDAYPDDTRPRAAIEAAKAYLVTHDCAARAAARAAADAAADAARAAVAAAVAAADAARAAVASDAARAADAAADAARAADAAAYAADAAADAAAAADTRQRIVEWMCAHIETLPVIG